MKAQPSQIVFNRDLANDAARIAEPITHLSIVLDKFRS